MRTEVAGTRIARKAGRYTRIHYGIYTYIYISYIYIYTYTHEPERTQREIERDAASKRETGQTSCYILEKHSNSDMKRGARSVNEDPRGNASGRRNEREERTVRARSRARCRRDGNGGKKGVSRRERGEGRKRKNEERMREI